MSLPLSELLPPVRALAEEAGRLILSYFDAPSAVDYKADDSPLTAADRASHEHLVARLEALTPGVPVLSEESDPGDYAARRDWARFWLVDPLDGTKEFVKRTGEFTVNVALIEGDAPVLGAVHVPAKGVTYFAAEGVGAFKQEGAAEPVPIRVRACDPRRLTVVASRDHAGPEVAAILQKMEEEGVEVSAASMGSSLKFCLVAEGKADLYPRTVPTFEWDTAAAQCVVEQAGGRLTTLDGERLRYNKADIRNPSVMTAGDAALDWKRYLPR
ncbi:MAG TPA: 3'(2'),5'-bisphosphate nucleotidase CysQ [Rubricoccaceae bacterium]|nr:3'(2'),5'-bisphosphate nucleotidase CysQ [Rubricoccaceae bacterium]